MFCTVHILSNIVAIHLPNLFLACGSGPGQACLRQHGESYAS